ncbi:MAG: amidase [Alteromonadaceae bacterium]|nr:amidase [Alteromonadaceae bacterium]
MMQITDPFVTNVHFKSSSKGQLEGMRLAVKDLFHVQGLPTNAGNPTWAATHTEAQNTASAVTKLMNESAVFVGKTHTDELAYSLNGQNVHFGTLKNPSAPDRLPGGSSSGSAIAVAMNLAEIGLGTDTGGSIRVPASYNNLWGLRPTHNQVAMDNTVPLAPCFDTVGWITRDLKTLFKVAKIMFPEQGIVPVRNDVRLSIATSLIDLCEHKVAMWQTLSPLEHTAATMDFEFCKEASEAFRVLQGYAIWQTHGDWILQHSPVFAPDIQARFDWCKTISESEKEQAENNRKGIVSTLENIFAKQDILVIPTTPGAAPLTSLSGDALNEYRSKLMGFTSLAGLAGLPQLHIPLPVSPLAPCGVSLIGRKNSELALLSAAAKIIGELL